MRQLHRGYGSSRQYGRDATVWSEFPKSNPQIKRRWPGIQQCPACFSRSELPAFQSGRVQAMMLKREGSKPIRVGVKKLLVR
jgi:hypothetical protein